ISTQTVAISSETSVAPPAVPPIRLWPGVLLIAAFWVVYVVNLMIDTTISAHFFTSVIGPGVVFLAFLIWWLTNRAIPADDRLTGLGPVIAGTWLAVRWTHESNAIAVFRYDLPAGLQRGGPRL